MRGIKFFLCILICFVFVGCEAKSGIPDYDISEYLDALEAMTYEAMFEAASPTVDIDEEAFVEKYDSIFSGLGVTSVIVQDVSAPTEDGTFYVTVTYKTESYGDYTNAFYMKSGFTDGVCKVLWDYSLIFPEMDEGYTVRVKTLHASRGEIFAADGTLLAQNAYADTLYMDTTMVASIDAVINAAGPLTGLSDSEINNMYEAAFEQGERIVLCEEFAEDELTQSDIDSLLSVPGLSIDGGLYMDMSGLTDISAVISVVGPLTGLSDTEIGEKYNEAINKGTQIVVLGEYFDGELTEEQADSVLAVSGLGIDDELYTPIRDYPMKEAAAHILGYIGYYNEENVPDESYDITQKFGLSGLELAYEDELRGSDGKIIYIEDEWGNNVRTLYEVPMSEGEDLRLTIKPVLQQRAYDALDTLLDEDETGVVVVMDADTGYVEALVSYPSYDNNQFTFGVSEEYWEYLINSDSNKPLYFRATQGQYPPGSAIKPFTAAIALEEGAITQDTVFTGEIIDNQWLPDEPGWVWDPITRVDKSGTPLVLSNALTKSDNIYFAFAALELGEDSLCEYFARIGFEEAVPFDLPVFTANLATTATIERRMLADMGYGQGELLISPIQLAAMYTAFANGSGDMLQPILVEKLCQTDGLDYNTVYEAVRTVWVEDAVSDESLDIICPILHEVVHGDGTGYRVEMDGVSIAGKTGTAEITDNKTREISWFAGYWEDGYYTRLVVVMVDTDEGEGTPLKFDIARELLSP